MDSMWNGYMYLLNVGYKFAFKILKFKFQQDSYIGHTFKKKQSRCLEAYLQLRREDIYCVCPAKCNLG